MIGESCDPASQGRPLSFLALCWGLGTVIGASPQTCRVPWCAEVSKLPVHFFVARMSLLGSCFLLPCAGPSLGGALSRPCDTFGNGLLLCGDGQLLRVRLVPSPI